MTTKKIIFMTKNEQFCREIKSFKGNTSLEFINMKHPTMSYKNKIIRLDGRLKHSLYYLMSVIQQFIQTALGR